MMKIMALKRFILSMVMVAFVVVSLTGCASLRKKFTRVKKQKDQKEEFIPVLEPIEYAKADEPPLQVYRNHYGMLKLYFSDLWDVLGKPSGGVKREKYLLKELLGRFDAMAGVLSDEKKLQAKGLRDRIEKALKEYDRQGILLRYDLMISDLRQVEREIYKSFKPDVVAALLQ